MKSETKLKIALIVSILGGYAIGFIVLSYGLRQIFLGPLNTVRTICGTILMLAGGVGLLASNIIQTWRLLGAKNKRHE